MALGRKNSLFAGSDNGARHWAIVASLVATAKLNFEGTTQYHQAGIMVYGDDQNFTKFGRIAHTAAGDEKFEFIYENAGTPRNEAADSSGNLPAAFPDDFPVPLPEGKDVFGRGGAAVCEPTGGAVVAGPLYDAEGIVFADCDLRRGFHAKRWFDVVGHYGRTDVLAPTPAAEVEAPS